MSRKWIEKVFYINMFLWYLVFRLILKKSDFLCWKVDLQRAFLEIVWKKMYAKYRKFNLSSATVFMCLWILLYTCRIETALFEKALKRISLGWNDFHFPVWLDVYSCLHVYCEKDGQRLGPCFQIFCHISHTEGREKRLKCFTVISQYVPILYGEWH